jgi:3-oxoadipate enol-lactonase
VTALDLSLSAPAGDSGPLVLLGPSLGTSSILWELVAPLLRHRCRVVTWELPGHGAAPAAARAFTVDDLADSLAAIVAPLGERCMPIGVSLGGAVSLTMALRHPARVLSVAAVASGARLGSPDAWHARAAQVRAQSTSSLVTASASRWFAPGSIERQPDAAGRLLRALQEADDESYALCCEALAAYDIRDRLASLAPPVLALWGEHDQVAPEASAAEVARGAQRGREQRIDAAGHLPPAEQPAAVAAELLRWIDETEEPR